MKTELTLSVGDQSPSDSEKWTLNVSGKTPLEADYGQVLDRKEVFARGGSHELTVDWKATNRNAGADYDYRAWVSGPSNEFFTVDDSALLQTGYYGDNENQVDPTKGKKAMLHLPMLDVDIDSDNSDPATDYLPTDNVADDKEELEFLKKGKFIPASTGDQDFDGVPDYIDFDGIKDGHFVPIALRLSANVGEAKPTKTSLTFTYDEADPAVALANPGAASGLTNPGLGGNLRLWTLDANQPRPIDTAFIKSGVPIDASKLNLTPGGTVYIYVEAVGAKRGANGLPIKVDAEVTGKYWHGTLTDTIHVRPIAVDLDIDTHNNSTFNEPQQDQEEDLDENRRRDSGGNLIPRSTLTAKVVTANESDADASGAFDGIPGFADGFDLFKGNSPDELDDDISAGAKFVPVVVRLPEAVDPAEARLQFLYSASDPAAVTRRGAGTRLDPYTYAPAPTGHLRLWTKDGSQKRDAATDFVKATDEHFIGMPSESQTPANLNFIGRTGVLWVEAISPVDKVTEETILVLLDPDGAGPAGFMVSDEVRLTVVSTLSGVDADRDGTIDYAGKLVPNADRPFQFWLNDDADRGEGVDATDEKVAGSISTDSADTKVNSLRDLEDFVELRLRYSKSLLELADTVSIAFKKVTSGSPIVRLRHAFSDPIKDDADLQAKDERIGQFTLTDLSNFLVISPAAGRNLTMDQFKKLMSASSDPGSETAFSSLIFEAVQAGVADLTFEFKKGANVLGSFATALDLRQIGDFYDHYSVAYGKLMNADLTDWGDPKLTPIPTTATQRSATAPPVQARHAKESDDYILFVHGWRMKDWERVSFGETAYKRLWRQGYTGNFGMFSWPTEWADLDGNLGSNLLKSAMDSGNFNRSEEIAWNSATALKNLLVQLRAKTPGKLDLVAHSMGNIVASEALNLSGSQRVVDTYVASQAAISAQYYSAEYPSDARATLLGVDAIPVEGSDYSMFGGNIGGPSPRFSKINRAAGKIVAFSNPADSALDSWEYNNAFKPSVNSSPRLLQPGFNGDRYTTNQGIPYRHPGVGQVGIQLVAGQNDYEMFAHTLQSKSKPLGASTYAFGPISGVVNLDAAPFNFGSDPNGHSAHFLSDNATRGVYWDRLLKEFGIK